MWGKQRRKIRSRSRKKTNPKPNPKERERKGGRWTGLVRRLHSHRCMAMRLPPCGKMTTSPPDGETSPPQAVKALSRNRSAAARSPSRGTRTSTRTYCVATTLPRPPWPSLTLSGSCMARTREVGEGKGERKGKGELAADSCWHPHHRR